MRGLRSADRPQSRRIALSHVDLPDAPSLAELAHVLRGTVLAVAPSMKRFACVASSMIAALALAGCAVDTGEEDTDEATDDLVSGGPKVVRLADGAIRISTATPARC